MSTAADTSFRLPSATFIEFKDRPAWLEGRRTLGIGSSDAAAILGVSRFKSPLSLYYEKLGLKPTSPKAAEAAEWGLELEEPIARRYAAKTGRFLAHPPPHSVARSGALPFAVASCDRFIVGHTAESVSTPDGMGVYEGKNAHYFMADEWSEDNNNEPPVEYQVQLQHQLMVTGLAWGSIAALIGGSYFVWADRARDEALIAVLQDREAEFWRRLELKDPPPADGHESTREILKKIYPKDSGEAISLGAEALDWHEQLAAAKLAEKAAKLNIDTYSNLLIQAIGNASVGVLPNGVTYSYKSQDRVGFYVQPTSFRVLRPSTKGQKG